MNDRTLVLVMTNGIGAHLTNDEKRAPLTDLRRRHLIDRVCVQEILPPEKCYVEVSVNGRNGWIDDERVKLSDAMMRRIVEAKQTRRLGHLAAANEL